MPLKALIFDLDGTLVDTAPDLLAAANHALSLIGRPAISDAQIRQFVGHGAIVTLKRGLEATGGLVSNAELKFLHVEFLKYYAANISAHSQVFPGVLNLLDKAQEAGLKLGVCTNKPEHLSHKLLNEIGLAGRFTTLVGGDTLPIMKPDPAPYVECCTRLGIEASQSLMFGDSDTDIKTAQNANAPIIAVSFGYTPQHVSTFNPTYVIDHYDEAWDLVAKHL